MTRKIAEVFNDPRLRESQDVMLEAELADRRGDRVRARQQYAKAAELQFVAAIANYVPPEERGILAVSVVSLYASAGQFVRAIETAERFLAEPDALAPDQATELRRLLFEHRATLAAESSPNPSPPVPQRLLNSRMKFRQLVVPAKAA